MRSAAFAVLIAWAGLCPNSTHAADVDSKPLHWSSEHTVWDRRKDLVTLVGSARVSQPGETIEAERITLNLNSRTLDAFGKCTYRASDTLIEAKEMHFNLDTRTGTIVAGRVTNGRFQLEGERINKLGEGRFLTHEAVYTTCRDCPGSWSFSGNDVDLQVEGYAYMSGVTANLKGTPVFWLPYAILPIKSQRQTGLLFPRLGSSTIHGFRVLLPFFWAIGRSTDMTFGAGYFGRRGIRGEWEGRYSLGPKSSATANFFYTHDRTLDSPTDTRWAGKLLQRQQLPWSIDEKLRVYEVSDNLYPVEFGSEDSIPGRQEPVLASDLSLSKQAPGVSAYIAARRYRNLLNFDDPLGFDGRTVQDYPKVAVNLNDTRPFGGPVSVGLNLGLDDFLRPAGPFDSDTCATSGSTTCLGPATPPVPGVDPVREAVRTSITPSLYTTFHLWDRISVVPSAEYRTYFYNFHEALPNLERGYLRLGALASLTMEKVYDTDDPKIPKIKHVIQPQISYSRIPIIQEPNHPFLSQVKYRNGYVFDNQDLVPFGRSPSLVNYFVPLGNSLTYAVSTQLIRKRAAEDDAEPMYQQFVDFRAGQTVDFLEFDKDETIRAPFSRLEAYLGVKLDRLSLTSQYYYYPDLEKILGSGSSAFPNPSPHAVSSSLTYILEKSLHQEILRFERSFSISHTWNRVNANTHNLSGTLTYSLNDNWMPALSASYDLLNQRFLSVSGSLLWQPLGRCFRLNLSVSQTVDRRQDWSIDFNINLTGEGFGPVGQALGGLGT